MNFGNPYYFTMPTNYIQPKIGFLGHTDTVEYIEGWNFTPFELTKKVPSANGVKVTPYCVLTPLSFPYNIHIQ